MAADVEEALLERYREELTFFRRMGAKFAQSYPRIAKRLELNGGPSPDPHVERLIEGVAFLTARLQNDLAGELPEVTAGLLGSIYPHFTQPVPSMAVARLAPDEGGAGLTTGVEVPKHTQLYVETTFQRRTCRFRTCYPVTLWPIEVQSARVMSPNSYDFLGTPAYAQVQTVLRLRLKTNSEPLSVLAPDRLRFYLNGDPALTGPLFELLHCNLVGIACLPEGADPGRAGKPTMAELRPVGFDPDEAVLPTQAHALPGYALLQEYFAFPEKFLFVDVTGISTEGAGDVLDLVFLFNATPRRRLSVQADTFALGCTPIVNLFQKVSEPVHINGKKHEYLVNPDARWERTTEVHTVLAVTPSLRLEEDDDLRIEPLYGLGHSDDEDVVYWHTRRLPARGKDLPGTDVLISFVDGDLRGRLPAQETLRVHMLCTNRDLATHLDAGEELYIEDGPHAQVTCLTRPTPQLTAPMQGATLWRLVSHLALSHLGLPDGEAATEALREQLRVYGFSSPDPIEPQLMAIEDVRREVVALRADDDAWRGFCRVQRVTIRVDEDRFSATSPILLGYVLNQYFGLHSSVNVFSQVALESRQREGTWKLWPPMIPKVGVR